MASSGKKMAAESIDDDFNCSNSGMANFDEQTPLLINEQGEENTKKLSTFFGVVIPCTLSMFSIILFLRVGYLVGQVGFVASLGLLTLAYFVTGLTTLSVSAISTNGNVKGGGVYFMISRALGPEFGGSIGVIFYVANLVSSGLYLIGFSEALISSFGQGGLIKVGSGLPTGRWYGFLYRSLALLFNLCVCLVGAGMFAKTSFFIFLGVIVSICSSFVSFIVQHKLHGLSVPPGNKLLIPNTTLNYTGWSTKTFENNLWPDESEDYSTHLTPSVLVVFGILFNGVTGIMAGANMSGDLKNPAKSIPTGTLVASAFTFVVYVMLITFTSATCSRPLLVNQYNYLQEINKVSALTTVGVFLATLSAALSCLIGASRVLQAVSNDNLLGSYFNIFGRGIGQNLEPVWAVLLSWFFVQCVIIIDEVNVLAPIVSMFFLLSYGVTNLACFVLKASSAPNFRPTFQYYSKGTALFGMLSCFAIMFAVNVMYASLAIVIMIVLFLVIIYRAPATQWGDVSQALIYHQVRKYLLRLDPRKIHIKYWRPQVLLLVSNPRSSYPLIDFANDIKKGGLYVLGNVIVDTFDGEAISRHKNEIGHWLNFVKCAEIKAFVDQVVSTSVRAGAQTLLMSSGLGGMKPNTVILGYFDHEDPEDLIAKRVWCKTPIFGRRKQELLQQEVMTKLPRLRENGDQTMCVADYIGIIKDSLLLEKNVCIARNFSSLEKNNIKKPAYIDVWPMNANSVQHSGQESCDYTYLLILQLSCILNMVPFWESRTTIRLMSIVQADDTEQSERSHLIYLLQELRIPGRVKMVHDTEESSSHRPTIGSTEWYEHLNQLMKVHSRDAAVIFTSLPQVPEQENLYNNFVRQISVLSEDLPPILMVHGTTSVISLAL